ncbi:MAG TPA: DUF3794 domain-containing protein [Firmicutes bacterium]|nr:DUF3794 domain-containing protein [Candidatus Fermentithermobacillaceae bacterium]
MSLDTLEVKTEEIRLEETIGVGTSQVVISEPVTVPEPKPPVASVIDFAGRTNITKVTVLPGKVIVDGVLELAIIYEAAVPYQTVHVFHAEVPFSTFVEIPGVEPGMVASPIVAIEHASFEVRPDGMAIVVRAVLMLTVRVSRTAIIDVVTDVSGIPGLQVTKEMIKAETVLGESVAQAVIREHLFIPEIKPDVVSIIDQVATIQINSTTILPNKVIVNGTISLRTIYEARTPYQTVHVVHHTIPFERFVEVPGIQPGMTVLANARIEFISVDVAQNGRAITARIIIEIHVKVIRVQKIQVVTNITGVAGLELVKELVRIQEVLGENKSQGIVREIVDIPEEKPLAMAILDSSSTPEVKRVIVAPGKIIVDGTIAQRIIYEPLMDPTQTVHTLHFTVPFSEFVVLPEAKPGMTARVSVQVEHANFEVPPAGEPIMVTKIIMITARVFRTRHVHVVVKVKKGVAKCTGTVTAHLVNVRQGPGLTFAVIAQVNAGTTVRVLEIQPEWLKVQLPSGQVGWIFAQYVKHDCMPRG